MLLIYFFSWIVGALSISVHQNKPTFDINKVEDYFQDFVEKFNKDYRGNEKNKRFNIFKQNLDLINKKNERENETAIFGITPFTDLTLDEFKNTYLNSKPGQISVDQLSFNCSKEASGFNRFDWRQLGAVTGVKNQAECGCGWAFSAVGNLESQYAIKYEKKFFSEQQLLDCDIWDMGCQGGSIEGALDAIFRMGGITSDEVYPYQAHTVLCRFKPELVAAKEAAYFMGKLDNESCLLGALYYSGPLSIYLAGEDLMHYVGGVLEVCQGEVNHAALLVGFVLDDAVNGPYWNVKNSFGRFWGEDGYLKLRFNENTCQFMTNGFYLSKVV